MGGLGGEGTGGCPLPQALGLSPWFWAPAAGWGPFSQAWSLAEEDRTGSQQAPRGGHLGGPSRSRAGSVLPRPPDGLLTPKGDWDHLRVSCGAHPPLPQSAGLGQHPLGFL